LGTEQRLTMRSMPGQMTDIWDAERRRRTTAGLEIIDTQMFEVLVTTLMHHADKCPAL